MQWRCARWVGDGYTLIGYGRYKDGRLRLTHEAEPVPPQAQPKDEGLALHWCTTRGFEPAELEPVLGGIASMLNGAGVTVTADARCGLSVETPNRHWMIRLQPNGVLTEVGRDAAPTRAESGRLLTADGTVPFLALMRIEREFPGAVRFVWVEQTDAWTVEPKLEAEDPYLGSDARELRRNGAHRHRGGPAAKAPGRCGRTGQRHGTAVVLGCGAGGGHPPPHCGPSLIQACCGGLGSKTGRLIAFRRGELATLNKQTARVTGPTCR